MKTTERMSNAVLPATKWRGARRALVATLAAISLAGGGCAGSKPPPVFEVPTDAVTVQGALSAGGDANPDPNGRPAPVLVRVYELSSDDPFKRLDFFSLFDHEPAVLGASLLRVREFPMVPGQTVDVSGQVDPRTQYFGAIAAVRYLDRAPWRVVMPRPPKTVKASQPQRLGMAIMVGAGGIALNVAELPAGQPMIPGLAAPAVPGVAVPGVTTPALPGLAAPAVPGVTAPLVPGLVAPAAPGFAAPTTPGLNAPLAAPLPGVTAPLMPGLAAPVMPGAMTPGVPLQPVAPVIGAPVVPGLTAPLMQPVPGVTAPVLPVTPPPPGAPVSPFAPGVPGARPPVPAYDPR